MRARSALDAGFGDPSRCRHLAVSAAIDCFCIIIFRVYFFSSRGGGFVRASYVVGIQIFGI